MKTALHNFILVLTSALLIAGCTSTDTTPANTEAPVKKHDKLNISILLDLSDRIDPKKYPSPSMAYYERDLGYIGSISKGFEKHLSSKPIRQIDDQMQVYFEPEPSDTEINGLAKKLKMVFTKDVTKDQIKNISPQYATSSQGIYQLAIREKSYVGADIWGFFKGKVKDYCIKTGRRNILFILTDGYMFYKGSQFAEQGKTSYLTPELVRKLKLNTSNYRERIKKGGFGYVKATDDLSDLEVVVIGINPAKGNPFEGDVIDAYWRDWFKQMKVKDDHVKILSADLPTNMDPLIQKYINNSK